MSIVGVRHNENNRRKKSKREKNKQTNKQTNKDKKQQGRTEAIVKGWELNGFVVHLSW